jgi:hypothetical protein
MNDKKGQYNPANNPLSQRDCPQCGSKLHREPCGEAYYCFFCSLELPKAFEVTNRPAFLVEEAVRAFERALDASRTCFDAATLRQSLIDQINALIGQSGAGNSSPVTVSYSYSPSPSVSDDDPCSDPNCPNCVGRVDLPLRQTAAAESISVALLEAILPPTPPVPSPEDLNGIDFEKVKSDRPNPHPLSPRGLDLRITSLDNVLSYVLAKIEDLEKRLLCIRDNK